MINLNGMCRFGHVSANSNEYLLKLNLGCLQGKFTSIRDERLSKYCQQEYRISHCNSRWAHVNRISDSMFNRSSWLQIISDRNQTVIQIQLVCDFRKVNEKK